MTTRPAGALSIDPRDYLYFALKHRWLILSILVLGTAASAFHTMRQTPEYQTTAVLQLSQERVRLGNEFLERDRLQADEFFATHIRLLESPAMAERIVNRLKLWEHPHWGMGPSTPSPPADSVIEQYSGRVRSMLFASHVSRTQLIEVHSTSESPELAALVANTAVQEYISFVGERETGVAKSAASLIKDQIDRLQEEIASNKVSLERQALADSQRSLSAQKVEELNRQLVEAQGQRAAAEARFETLSTTDPGRLPEVMSDVAVQASEHRLVELRGEYQAMLSRFKAEWPEVQRLKSTIDELEARLLQQKRDVAERVIREARGQADQAARKEASLRSTLIGQEREIQRLDSTLGEFDRRKLELESQTEILQSLLLRQSEAGFQADVEGTPAINARIVQEAKVPRRPYKPNLRQNLLMGAMASLFLSFGLVFALETFRTSITTVEDVRRNVQAPYLGMIPRYTAEGGVDPSRSVRDSYLVVPTERDLELSEEHSQVAESFKFLRTMLTSVAGNASKTFVITSPGKGSGKTFVACNLAISLAQVGKKVLLIDGDLRLSRLHKIFGCANEEGVSSVLEGSTYIERTLFRPSGFPGLSVLPAGPSAARPSEFIQFERLEAALRGIIAEFDLVIIDSAPLLPVPDTIDLTKFCDEIVLTLRSGEVTRQAVAASMDLVQRAGRRVTGVVLNDVNLREISTMYYQAYRHGFGGYSYKGGHRAEGSPS